MQDAPAGTVPACPTCRQDLTVVWRTPIGPEMAMFGAKLGQYALMCPHCRALLAVV